MHTHTHAQSPHTHTHTHTHTAHCTFAQSEDLTSVFYLYVSRGYSRENFGSKVCVISQFSQIVVRCFCSDYTHAHRAVVRSWESGMRCVVECHFTEVQQLFCGLPSNQLEIWVYQIWATKQQTTNTHTHTHTHTARGQTSDS